MIGWVKELFIGGPLDGQWLEVEPRWIYDTTAEPGEPEPADVVEHRYARRTFASGLAVWVPDEWTLADFVAHLLKRYEPCSQPS